MTVIKVAYNRLGNHVRLHFHAGKRTESGELGTMASLGSITATQEEGDAIVVALALGAKEIPGVETIIRDKDEVHTVQVSIRAETKQDAENLLGDLLRAGGLQT